MVDSSPVLQFSGGTGASPVASLARSPGAGASGAVDVRSRPVHKRHLELAHLARALVLLNQSGLPDGAGGRSWSCEQNTVARLPAIFKAEHRSFYVFDSEVEKTRKDFSVRFWQSTLGFQQPLVYINDFTGQLMKKYTCSFDCECLDR